MLPKGIFNAWAAQRTINTASSSAVLPLPVSSSGATVSPSNPEIVSFTRRVFCFARLSICMESRLSWALNRTPSNMAKMPSLSAKSSSSASGSCSCPASTEPSAHFRSTSSPLSANSRSQGSNIRAANHCRIRGSNSSAVASAKAVSVSSLSSTA